MTVRFLRRGLLAFLVVPAMLGFSPAAAGAAEPLTVDAVDTSGHGPLVAILSVLLAVSVLLNLVLFLTR